MSRLKESCNHYWYWKRNRQEICLYLAKEGAKIVVNDLGGDRDGSGEGRVADEVVEVKL